MVSRACESRVAEVLERAPRGGLVIEVGALRGHMCMLGKRMRPDLSWIMVDSWLPMSRQPQHYIETKDDHALHSEQEVGRNRASAYTVAMNSEVSVLNMTSLDAARLLGDIIADVVFIDADHSYEGCSQDIRAWWPKVNIGGWIGGHDYRNPDPRFGGVDRAVDEFARDRAVFETGQNYTWWARA